MYISYIGHPGIEFEVVGEQAVAIGGRGIKMSETAKKLGSTPPVTLSEFHFGLHARSIAISLSREPKYWHVPTALRTKAKRGISHY